MMLFFIFLVGISLVMVEYKNLRIFVEYENEQLRSMLSKYVLLKKSCLKVLWVLGNYFSESREREGGSQ